LPFAAATIAYLQLTLWSLVLIRALHSRQLQSAFQSELVIGQFSGRFGGRLGESLRCLTTDACSSTPGWVLGSGSMLVVSLWALLAIYAIGRLLLRRTASGRRCRRHRPRRIRGCCGWWHSGANASHLPFRGVADRQ
jgi:hypothetical protein